MATGLIDLRGSLYKDNMKADGWFFGTITETDYLLQRFEFGTKYNLTSCPLDKPFVNVFENYCFKCDKDDAYFDMGSRNCYSCQPGSFFKT